MRLATFNILHGRSPVDGAVDLERFAAAVRRLDADVLALQEVDRDQPRSLLADLTAVASDAMGARSHRFVAALAGTPGATWMAATGDEQPGTAAYGVALLSRYPVRSWQVIRAHHRLPAPGLGADVPGGRPDAPARPHPAARFAAGGAGGRIAGAATVRPPPAGRGAGCGLTPSGRGKARRRASANPGRGLVEMRLAGSTVLITGASGGIGADTARVLAAHGANVVLHGRNRDVLDALAADLAAPVVAADLSTSDGIEALIAGVRSVTGPVEVVVHCAGVGWRGDLTAMSAEDVTRLIAVNLRAPIQLTRAFLPSMRAAGHGHVAFVGSIAGLTGVCHEAVYSAGKAGLDAFAESLRMELAGTGIGVSTLSPGAVDTGFWTARGSEYHRRIPRPVTAGRIARLLVADIEHERSNRIVPRWLALAPFTRALAPSAYRHLATRFG